VAAIRHFSYLIIGIISVHLFLHFQVRSQPKKRLQ